MLMLAGSLPAAARAAKAGLSAIERLERDHPYQAGLDHYARGERAAALASFREALRREPDNHSALAAIIRLESELAPQPTPLLSPEVERVRGSSSGRVERFFIVSVPRWFHFERTVGNPLSDLGTLNAFNARIVQLLGEKKFASAHNRRFGNDRELRELLRRLPVAAHQQRETV
jgi:hypothetical protein